MHSDPKEEPNYQKSSVVSVRKNQSKILKYCFVLLVAIQVWFDFYALTRAKNNFLNLSLRLSRHKSFGCN